MGSSAENPWGNLREQAGAYILKDDEAAIRSFNASLTPQDPRRIELHVLPEPFLGFHDAPVVVLLANPGSVVEDRHIEPFLDHWRELGSDHNARRHAHLQPR
jgi:hypothetical protein